MSFGFLLAVVAVSVIALILLVAVIIALILTRKRRNHYGTKKDGDIELKQPLNYNAISSVQASPVPNDHLAKLDEFSAITSRLGPKSEW